jgi:predicted O-linked N-acetylglucosamine transferase (SPINDLY family)
MGRLTSRFVTHHNSSLVKSVSFSFGPSDQSEMRERIEKFSPIFVNLEKSVVAIASDAADIISSYQLDILIDLTALTFNGRYEIPAMRPAPLIINYLGYPGPAGCLSYDYTIVDSISLPPESSSSFGEKLIYLNDDRVYQGNDMPMHVPLLCNQQRCPSEILFTDKNGTVSSPAIINNDTVLLCTFNANKKLEPISFRGSCALSLVLPSDRSPL